MQTLFRLFLILFIASAIFSVFYFNLFHYLSFSALKTHRYDLLRWTEQHYAIVVLCFMAIYFAITALSIPGPAALTIMAGFLFGPWFGTLYVIVAATLGAIVIFLIVRFVLTDWFTNKTGKWVHKMQHGFQNNAVSYLFFLRLVPLFPFFIVNAVPALLNVKLRTFSYTTFLGIIPGTFVYVLVGNGLGHVFDSGQQPNLGIIFEPPILIPILALAILALVPIVYKKLRKRRHEKS